MDDDSQGPTDDRAAGSASETLLAAKDAPQDTLRIALLSTPRSGNTWLRSMLAAALDLEETAAHNPAAVDWTALPRRMILQMHWRRDPDFLAALAKHGFRVVVICRHPLDVLISLLAYVQHGRETAGWLDGLAGDESDLVGSSPSASGFLKYAMGARAKALLHVGTEWWSASGTVRVRYEALVEDPLNQLTRVVDELGVRPKVPPADVIARSAPDNLRSRSIDLQFHVWQAQPALWKRLLPGAVAQLIHEAQRAAFEVYGYTCDLDERLDSVEAQRTWERLEQLAMQRNLVALKDKLNAAEARNSKNAQHLVCEFHRQATERETLANHLGSEFARQAAERETLSRSVEALSRSIADLQTQNRALNDSVARLHQRLEFFEELGPRALTAARTLRNWSRRWRGVIPGAKGHR
jgi:hypothetical protein